MMFSADADRAPHPFAVGGINEDAGGGGRRPVLIQDADFVVGEMDGRQLRIVRLYRLTEGVVQGVDGAVALGGGYLPLSLHEELYGGLGLRLPVRVFVCDYAEGLQLE